MDRLLLYAMLVAIGRGTPESREVSLSSVLPARSCRSGGVVVRLAGSRLSVVSKPTVHLAGVPCPLVSVSDELIVCRSGALPAALEEQPRDVNGTTVYRDGPVTLSVGERTVTLGDSRFQYTKDPRVDRLAPRRGFFSGGTLVRLEGDHLHVVQRARITWVVKSDASLSDTLSWSTVEGCSLGRELLCPVPNVSMLVRVGSARSDDTVLEADMRLGLDGVGDTEATSEATSEAGRHRFHFHPDPEVFPFEEEDGIRALVTHEVVLQGRHLDSIGDKDDVRVTVGHWLCNVTTLTRDDMSCILDAGLTQSDEKQLWAVKVVVGNLVFTPGSLRVMPGERVFHEWLIALMVLAPVALFGIVACVCCCCRRQPRRRRGSPASDVADLVEGGAGGTGRRCLTSLLSSEASASFVLTAAAKKRAPKGAPCSSSLRRAATYLTLPQLLEDGSPASKFPQRSANRSAEVLRKVWATFDHVIDSKRIKLLKNIGADPSGCTDLYFGVLMAQRASEHRYELEVTVKTLKDALNSGQDPMRIVEEGRIMSKLSHENVLSLVGICMSDTYGPMLVMPFMANGHLATYIRDEQNELTLHELTSFGLDVARGMAYLSDAKLVHLALWGQSCMLDERGRVKIASLSLCREVDEQGLYVESRRIPLPIRWMAGESMERCVFTSKSNVWSYGVLLWELMTRGQLLPYAEVDVGDLLQLLESGHRLPQPEHCPEELYPIMLRCWNKAPSERPTFGDLVRDVVDVVALLEQTMPPDAAGGITGLCESLSSDDDSSDLPMDTIIEE